MKTSKKLRIALLISFLLFLCVSGFIVSQVFCQNTNYERIISPDERLTVERYTIDCGARNSTKTYVNIFPSNRNVPGETIFGIYGLASKELLNVTWTATDTIKIINYGSGNYRIAESNKFGVHVDYESQDPPELKKYLIMPTTSKFQ